MDTKETGLYYILIISSGIISGILLYAFITAVMQQAKNRWVHFQEIESEINSLEQERTRIAADLHDDLGPVLSAAIMKLAALKHLQAGDAQLVNSSISNIETITGRIRAIAAGLMPSVLANKGLVVAVGYFIQNLNLNSKVHITLDADDLPPLNHAVNIHLYRILQEIIHNSCKHGNAARLRINIQYRKGSIILATVDDGAGFDYDEVLRQKKGYGLLNIQNRVQFMNGNFHIKTSNGTRYYIEIPLPGLSEKMQPVNKTS
jgi:two-component system, NarL family, sensor kinase